MVYHSSIETAYYLLPLIGFLIGLFATLIGGGGGFFFIPLLILLYQVPAQTAVITSLVATLPICFVGSVMHYRYKQIEINLVGTFAVAGMAGAFAGAFLTSVISPSSLKLGFGIYSIFIALFMVYRTRRDILRLRAKKPNIPFSIRKKRLLGSTFGFFSGLITGTFGTSGTAPVIIGLFTLQIPVKLVIGTSMLIILMNTLFATGAHIILGKIDIMLVVFLSSGSIVGAILGPKLLAKIKTELFENKIKYGYSFVIIVLGFLMIIG